MPIRSEILSEKDKCNFRESQEKNSNLFLNLTIALRVFDNADSLQDYQLNLANFSHIDFRTEKEYIITKDFKSSHLNQA